MLDVGGLMPRSMLAWAIALVLALAGCGSQSANSGASLEEQAVHALVSSLPDRAGSPKRAAEQYAELKPDAELCKRIAAYQFVPQSIAIEGDTARVKVKVYNAETSLDVAETDWTAVKRDGAWKLQDAPIP